MTEAVEQVRQAIAKVVSMLEAPCSSADEAAGWNEKARQSWHRSLLDIRSFMDGADNVAGFSIVRSLDMGLGHDAMEHPIGRAIMAVSSALHKAGIAKFA